MTSSWTCCPATAPIPVAKLVVSGIIINPSCTELIHLRLVASFSMGVICSSVEALYDKLDLALV